MNVWRGSWGVSWLNSWGEARRAAIVYEPGAGKLHLPYFEPAWATLKPQNVRQLVSHVSLFFSIRSIVTKGREIRSHAQQPLRVVSAQFVGRAARSFARLGFNPRPTSTVVCGVAARSRTTFGIAAGSSTVNSIRRESRAAVAFSASSKPHATTANRSSVSLFTSTRSHFANRQLAVAHSRTALSCRAQAVVECTTKISRIAEMDRRDIDLVLLLAA